MLVLCFQSAQCCPKRSGNLSTLDSEKGRGEVSALHSKEWKWCVCGLRTPPASGQGWGLNSRPFPHGPARSQFHGSNTTHDLRSRHAHSLPSSFHTWEPAAGSLPVSQMTWAKPACT